MPEQNFTIEELNVIYDAIQCTQCRYTDISYALHGRITPETVAKQDKLYYISEKIKRYISEKDNDFNEFSIQNLPSS